MSSEAEYRKLATEAYSHVLQTLKLSSKRILQVSSVHRRKWRSYLKIWSLVVIAFVLIFLIRLGGGKEHATSTELLL